MRRLLATMRCDVTLQWRHGFYYATAFVLIFWVAVVSRLPALNLGWLLPALVLGNLLMNTFYFISGLVLLEKGEGTLEAQVVTPLRTGEYLTSKIVTLMLLSLIENLIIVVLLYGFRFSLWPLVASITLTSVLYSLAGVATVARYASINEFLLPSVLYTTLASAPLLPYLNQWEAWPLYLHPVQATLVLAQAAFRPMAGWQVVYGLLYSAFWVGLMASYSQRVFRRNIITGAGGG